jgi:hypothetical protein
MRKGEQKSSLFDLCLKGRPSQLAFYILICWMRVLHHVLAAGDSTLICSALILVAQRDLIG